MRDQVHFYFRVDHELVWKAIKQRLPQIRAEIEKILDKP